MANLLIVDDDSATRCMLRLSLEQDWDVVGEAENGFEALQVNEQLQPQVVLLDISMPGMDGFGAAKRLKQATPAVHIIFVSSHTQSMYVEEAFRVGGEAYVLKGSAGSDLTKAIREVLAGRRFQSLLPV